MGLAALGSRAVIGRYYRSLEQYTGASWIPMISNYFTSDQSSETYEFLGQSPAFREWIGGRHAKGLWENNFAIANKHYEATLEIPVRHMRRDKTGQINARIDDLAQRTNAHWASLLTTLMLNGPSTVCYDGQFFFDTDHTEGNNTTSQSNDISADISAYPASVAGTTTAPSVEEMQFAIYDSISAIMSFKDNENEPMNENANAFLVMVPVSLMKNAQAAVYRGGDARQFASQSGFDAIESLAAAGVSISVVGNARLTWTTSFATFRTDSPIKSFIRQEETAPMMKAKAEGSEFEFDNDAHQYGVDSWRNVGYGYWQNACYTTLI